MSQLRVDPCHYPLSIISSTVSYPVATGISAKGFVLFSSIFVQTNCFSPLASFASAMSMVRLFVMCVRAAFESGGIRKASMVAVPMKKAKGRLLTGRKSGVAKKNGNRNGVVTEREISIGKIHSAD